MAKCVPVARAHTLLNHYSGPQRRSHCKVGLGAEAVRESGIAQITLSLSDLWDSVL